MFIPVNKELVPTRNIQKIIGKKFVAVDKSEKVGEALTPEEFLQRRSGVVQSIVYEIKEDTPKAFNIYTDRTSIASPTHRQSIPFASIITPQSPTSPRRDTLPPPP